MHHTEVNVSSRKKISIVGLFHKINLFLCSGDVITTECFEKLIKKDMVHPLTGQKLKEKDIIHLQRVFQIVIDVFREFNLRFIIQGGTGFASANEKLEATEARPNMVA